MCIGCDIGQLDSYLDDYLYPYQRVQQDMKRVERNLLDMLKLDLDLEHRAALKRQHKRLVRIRRQWGRAHCSLAADVSDYEKKREAERTRIEGLDLGPAIEGPAGLIK